MSGILQGILDFLLQLVCWIMTALVLTFNLIIAALGALIAAAIELLPEIDGVPAVPDEITAAAGWVNWFFPVGTVLNFFTFIVGAWLLWQAVVLGLRWAKATDE